MIEDLQAKILNEIEALHASLNLYGDALQTYANRDHEYRKAQADAMMALIAGAETRNEKLPTDPVKRAIVDQKCEMSRLKHRLAEADKDNLKARVDAHKTVISALQSLLGIHKTEANAVRFGQYGGA